MNFKEDYDRLAEKLASKGISVEDVKNKLKTQHIETPSWGYGNGGTRFKVFAAEGAARNIYEKIDDAAYIHSLSGVSPSIAIHIPWDKVEDYDALGQYAKEKGIAIGAVNPNFFQDDQYKLGSLTNPSPAIREEAMGHMIECCEIMGKTGSKLLSLWFADGTNYAGQDSIRERKHRLEQGLMETTKYLPVDGRMLIEYKFFEPAFYHTDLADWGMAYAMALKCGAQAQVLVDTGHHAQGTNIAHIVSFLLDERRLGGFHFNARRYADDDLIVGTNNPYELFEIYTELVQAGERANDVAYMIDQSHNIEPKLEAMLLSVLNCQTAYARALIVDYKKLGDLQLAGDVLGAQQVMVDAFDTDIRPLLMQVRTEKGLTTDPIATYRSGEYVKKVAKERGITISAGSALQ
ncbi:MAG: L-rhamnose isomerase [Chloroflexi bacterium]|nr:L-rhamnose isomerase [Chloroflexota bacterium]MCC6893042.1 L-rhamnose isomerase [Anaerolineae bacterium]